MLITMGVDHGGKHPHEITGGHYILRPPNFRYVCTKSFCLFQKLWIMNLRKDLSSGRETSFILGHLFPTSHFKTCLDEFRPAFFCYFAVQESVLMPHESINCWKFPEWGPSHLPSGFTVSRPHISDLRPRCSPADPQNSFTWPHRRNLTRGEFRVRVVEISDWAITGVTYPYSYEYIILYLPV